MRSDIIDEPINVELENSYLDESPKSKRFINVSHI